VCDPTEILVGRRGMHKPARRRLPAAERQSCQTKPICRLVRRRVRVYDAKRSQSARAGSSRLGIGDCALGIRRRCLLLCRRVICQTKPIRQPVGVWQWCQTNPIRPAASLGAIATNEANLRRRPTVGNRDKRSQFARPGRPTKAKFFGEKELCRNYHAGRFFRPRRARWRRGR